MSTVLSSVSLRTHLATDNAPNTATVINGINWGLLRRQKFTLLDIAKETNSNLREAHLDGLIHLLDSLQDAVVEDGLVSETAVFGG